MHLKLKKKKRRDKEKAKKSSTVELKPTTELNDTAIAFALLMVFKEQPLKESEVLLHSGWTNDKVCAP